LMKDRRKNKHFESRERPIKVMAQKNKWWTLLFKLWHGMSCFFH
jgi:hypothetical protein